LLYYQVSKRDQSILKLNTELNTVHEQYKGTKEENEMHVAEIDRLNSRLKTNSSELKDIKETSEGLSTQVLRSDFFPFFRTIPNSLMKIG